MIINVLSAIQNQFSGNAALRARFPDGCYLERSWDGAPVTEDNPICIVEVEGVPDYDTSNDFLSIYVVIFTAYCMIGMQAANAVEEIEAAFDFANIAANGTDKVLESRRTKESVTMDDEKVWMGKVEYKVMVNQTY